MSGNPQWVRFMPKFLIQMQLWWVQRLLQRNQPFLPGLLWRQSSGRLISFDWPMPSKPRLQELAQAESKDTGKPLWLAQSVDIPRAVRNFRFFASALPHFASESHSSQAFLNYTLRQPLGVVACISPWNLPLYLLTWKIAPALAAGNTVVAKPSEITPLTAYLLGEIAIEAGLPTGVLNVIMGSGAKTGAALTADPRIKAVSFTGSTRTGAEIARVVAPKFKKLSLEMGGKNAAIVFADCDYEKTLETLLRAAFSNQGQICLCMSRVYIEASLYDRFKSDFVARAQAIQVGDPLLPDSRLGALVSWPHLEKVRSYVDLAIQEGGSVLCGGGPLQMQGRIEKGWYFAPTVLAGLTAHCRTNQEEIFGPVVSLMPFETEAEAVDLANGTEYGLAATLWTTNHNRVMRLSPVLQAGVVWVNCWMERDLRTLLGCQNVWSGTAKGAGIPCASLQNLRISVSRNKSQPAPPALFLAKGYFQIA
jgi:aminomuconate-semialdehyde/2-hydroxymuconate-6-semialdehyde dehydrogenase